MTMRSNTIFFKRRTLLQLLVFIGCFFSPCFSKTKNCLGLEEYEDTHQICCNGRVTALVDDQKCCGGKYYYNPNEEICCNNQVFDKYKMDNDSTHVEQQCCGGQVHQKKGFYCCSDQLIPLTNQQEDDRHFLQCCNNNVVANSKEQFCCGGKDYKLSSSLMCCNDTIMITEHKRCYNNEQIIGKNENICGEELYNMRNASCCDNKINHIFPELIDGKSDLQLRCCGTIPYKDGEKTCCPHVWGQTTAHVIPVGLQCCGDTHYNKSNGEACVENQPVRNLRKSCQRNMLNPNCCNGQELNTKTEQCCGGMIIPNHRKCCNGYGLDENELCCYGSACKKESNEDNDCCYNYLTYEMKTFCNTTQACNQDGQIVSKPRNTELCGNNLSFKPEDEICCGVTKWSKAKGYNECCRELAINSTIQQCCLGTVYDFPAHERRCCILDGKVYPKNDVSNPCLEPCSNSFYDPDTQICCNGKVRSARSNRQCCGGKIINTSKRECCNGKTSIRKGGNKTCCGGLKINSKKLQCCARNIPFKSKTHGCCDNKTVYRLNDYSCSNGTVTRRGKWKDLCPRQKFCHKDNLRYGDGLVEVACQPNIFAVEGTFKDGAISRKVNGSYIVDIWISTVSEVMRHNHVIRKTKSLDTLEVIVKLSVEKDVKCRGKYFKKLKNKKVYMFLKKKPSKYMEIYEKDFVYMTKYSNLKRKVLSQISVPFCHHIL